MVGGCRACDNGSPLGGVGQVTCNGSQFEPPLPGLYGYGSATCFTGGAGAGGGCTPAQAIFWAEKFHFNIMDQVLVPRELEAGEYALSFRWVRPIPAPFAPGPASFLRTDLRTAVLALRNSSWRAAIRRKDAEGARVLQDCEQTPQVWSQCADVTLR